jgi:hypothetical protein
MKFRVILLFLITLSISCSDDKEYSSCWGQLIDEGDSYLISNKGLCYYWSGYEYLHLQIKEKGSEKITEKPIDFNNSCIDFVFDPSKDYSISVFYGCYLDGKYSLRFHKVFEIKK